MLSIEGVTAQEVWLTAARALQGVTAVQESRNQSTRELLHVAFTITDPRQRLVFARSMNPAFAVAEVLWILAGANDAGFLSFWNPRMRQFVDANPERFHGAYGYRLGSRPPLDRNLNDEMRRNDGSEARLDQLRAACDALLHTPYSRQVVLQIWDSALDLPNPQPRSKDVPCNLLSHLLIRNGRLEWLQIMRSNDLIWGTPYNFVQWTCIQEIMAGWLNLDVGSYTHLSDSLHVYERHWQALDAEKFQSSVVPVNRADLRVYSYEEWAQMWPRLITAAVNLSRLQHADKLVDVMESLQDVPPAYREWIALLTAEALRRRGYVEQAVQAIDAAGEYWKTSWLQWSQTAGDKSTADG